MIRQCSAVDFKRMLTIVNDSAEAYRGTIPDDCWREPYMSPEELSFEVGDGVVFWGFESGGTLIGVMGIQDRGDVTLIRHAYVLTGRRGGGVGGELLRHLLKFTNGPVLVGTWAAASWAIGFYEKNGFRLVTPGEKDRLLKKYWKINSRQIEMSVVLGDAAFFNNM